MAFLGGFDRIIRVCSTSFIGAGLFLIGAA